MGHGEELAQALWVKLDEYERARLADTNKLLFTEGYVLGRFRDRWSVVALYNAAPWVHRTAQKARKNKSDAGAE